MKILLNYNITSEQFGQLAENQDFDAMLRIGRILNIMTTLAEAEVSYLKCHPLLADVRRSEVLRVKHALNEEAERTIDDIYDKYIYLPHFDSLMELHDCIDSTEGPKLSDLETIPFRLSAECPAIDRCLRDLDFAGRDMLNRPGKDNFVERGYYHSPDVDTQADSIAAFSNQYASAALEFILGIASELDIDRITEEAAAATT